MVYLGKPYHFKLFKGFLPQILLGPFLNTLSQLMLGKVAIKTIALETIISVVTFLICWKISINPSANQTESTLSCCTLTSQGSISTQSTFTSPKSTRANFCCCRHNLSIFLSGKVIICEGQNFTSLKYLEIEEKSNTSSAWTFEIFLTLATIC